jgi:hypothetical protein
VNGCLSCGFCPFNTRLAPERFCIHSGGFFSAAFGLMADFLYVLINSPCFGGEGMKVIQVSDELYDKLKSCVVDPFDDTPESVIGRLIDISNKAKNRWSPLDTHAENAEQHPESQNRRPGHPEHWKQQAEVVL